MAMIGKIKVEVEMGPVMRTALDVLDYSADLADAIPDSDPRKYELLMRGSALTQICRQLLKEQSAKSADGPLRGPS